ncbi:hypothetical protein DSM106972_087760 [Dulcicalothrix desertica PCC 7102]|uniref:Peptidoglycan binding-like domain-containing protein n=1 Tax=Dulcicalothrix desertica PCC 7102 TaxID=232991 RepID=A0A3S1IEI7_9CYAN|nr:peptidoglycan-binding domain-containing protein [Dulcicalothrix desertica]RUS96234.1 hypothetical protein DSM106972_087760 [Dulcicalothrix desertica PCC 7102]TWH40441.1 putative peptidoglycan-binding domain-containing protein [Dulcicalothrix desertica PCC 7102]
MKGRNEISIINYLVSVISFKLLSRKNLLGLLLCSGVPLLFSTPSVASVTVEQQIAQVITVGTVNRPTLKVGSQGDAVSELQAALKIMGYYNGAVDGTYGQTTAAAVSQFKQSAGLAPDGVVDTATWQQLFPGGQTVAASSDETSSPATTTNTNFPKPNQTAANLPKPVVVSNQESRTTTTTRINTGNGQQETVRTTSTTRNSNNNTSRQTTRTTNQNSTNNRGRNTTNTASTRTNANRNNTNNTSTANRGRNTTTTTSTRNTNNRTARSTASNSSTYRTRQTDSNLQKPGIQYTAAGFPILRLGMRGEEVYDLQTRLQRLGYLKNNPDGDFGADTETAVKALQKRFGMEADGVAGGETWEILTRRRTNRSQS